MAKKDTRMQIVGSSLRPAANASRTPVTPKSTPASKKAGSSPKKSSPTDAPPRMLENTATPEAAIGQALALVTNKAASVLMLKVVDDASLATANNLLVEFKKAKDLIEEKRKFFLGPMKESLKRLESQFKVPALKLLEADRELRNKVTAFLAARTAHVEERKAEFVAKAEAAAAKGDDEGALAMATAAVSVPMAAKTMHTESSRVSMREVWDFEVTDYGLVPEEFFTLDESKVRKAIHSGQTDIPGIRAFKKPTLSVGGI